MREFILSREVIQLIEEMANLRGEQISIEREKVSLNVQISYID